MPGCFWQPSLSGSVTTWWVPHWQPCVLRWDWPHVCIAVCTCFPGSLKTYRVFSGGCERTTGDVSPPGLKWKLQGDGGEVMKTPPNSTWVFLANSHSSWNELRTFLLGGKQSYASRTLSRVNSTFSIDSSCDFRQFCYLFPALISEKMRITKFGYDLFPSKVEVRQEHLSWGQWICKDVKAGEINNVHLQV